MTSSSLEHSLLSSRQPIIAPGVADTMGALAAQRAGFKAIFLSGSSLAQVHLGRPDIGLADASELSAIARRITERCDIPVCVDIDTGFGNAFNVFRTVKSLSLTGVACVQMEDQETVKPLAAVLRRPVISLNDMRVKIHAALDARGDSGMLISARTDARFEEGLNSAIERALAYAECGADLIFVEGLSDSAERAQLRKALGPDVPRVFNSAISKEPPATALKTACDEGYKIVLGPTWVTAAAARAITASLAEVAGVCPAGTVTPVDTVGESDVATLIEAEQHLKHYLKWESQND